MKYLVVLCLVLGACSSIPEPPFQKHEFPKQAQVGLPNRAYEIIGQVKSKVNYSSLDSERDENKLCGNAFNRAAELLVKYGQKKGADAVIDVRSVVFLVDGKVETFPKPECSDDGSEGQVLAQGLAVKWKTPDIQNNKQAN